MIKAGEELLRLQEENKRLKENIKKMKEELENETKIAFEMHNRNFWGLKIAETIIKKYFDGTESEG